MSRGGYEGSFTKIGTSGCRVGVFTYMGGHRQGRHAHEFTGISMVLAGRVQEHVGAHAALGPTHHVVVKPRGTFHENAFRAHRTVLIQLALSDEAVREAVDAGCPLEDWRWSHAADMAPAFVRLARLYSRNASGHRLREALDDVLSGVELSPTGGVPPRWLTRARQRLREAEREGAALSVTQLAGDAGVHRVHLSRAFRRHFGTSPTEYRIRVRLRRAADQVGAGRESLSAAAHGAGFADQAHMTREFGRRLGVTPLQYRRLVSRLEG